jgi:aspartyl-tRNA(Asn)/glutamyl-tRNA(Gln) amidotransferase subunit B
MNAFTTVIGLEVHVQLATATKLFSPAPVATLGEPNTRVHAIDLGLPGVLPLLNATAVQLAVRAALALEGDVQRVSRFARKNYFYPDLPKGYQISQFDEPICRGGRVPLGGGRHGQLHRIHLEEDAGKLVHTDLGTLVDLNRAGVPLIEVVGEPDLRAPAEAHAFLVHLRDVLRFAGVSDCDMELGSMRCDANISLMPAGASQFGTKVEIKNLNSMKMVQRALEYEERRQAAVLAAGGRIAAETRLWNEEKGETRPLRSKEQAPDYRYCDDPNIPPLVVDDACIADERARLGELPDDRRRRYRTSFALPDHDVDTLTQSRTVGDWFERVLGAGAEPKPAANWVIATVLPACRDAGCDLDGLQVTPVQLAHLLQLVAQKTLTIGSAQQVFRHLLAHGGEPATAMQQLGLTRIVDEAVVGPWVADAVAALPAAVADVRAGREKPLEALKGHVMRASKGRADPALVERLLRFAIAVPPPPA